MIKPLCIILPEINGYIKYLKSRGKNKSFLTKYEKVSENYEDIYCVI